MRTGLFCCLLAAFATNTLAHRLDEYLQAIRIAVATNRLDVSVDLTPGVSIGDQLLPVIDPDRDGRISETEASAYAERVLKDVAVRLDEKACALRLVEAAFPKLAEIKSGHGVIRIKATASVGPLAGGRHTLVLTNAHLPAISVYLVNALVPKDSALKLGEQTRDKPQKAYRLEFEVKPRTP
jgi:hypothetical protein